MSDFCNEHSDESLGKVKQFARTDWGGKNAIDQIKKKFKAEGIDCGDHSAAIVKKICEQQVEGVRKRQFPRIDEVIRRLRCDDGNTPPPTESLP
jgi:hypothetical protein